MRKTAIFALDDGLLSSSLDRKFAEFLTDKGFVRDLDIILWMPRIFVRLGWVSETFVDEAFYSELLSGASVAWLDRQIEEFVRSVGKGLLRPRAEMLLPVMGTDFDEVVFVSESMSLLATELVSKVFGLGRDKMRVVGNVLEIKKGFVTGKMTKDSCHKDERFLMACDAMTVSPEELWVFGAGRKDDVFFPFADVMVDMSGQGKIMKGESIVRNSPCLKTLLA